MEEVEIIEQIKANNELIIKNQFEMYKEDFISFFRSRSNIDDDNLNDIYIDTFYDFYDYIIQGKLKEVNASIKTLIISFGKHKVFNFIRDNKRLYYDDKHHSSSSDNIINLTEESEEEKKIHLVRKALKTLRQRCRELLNMFYWMKLSRSEIAENLNLGTAGQVGVIKHRCMKELEGIVKRLFVQSDIY